MNPMAAKSASLRAPRRMSSRPWLSVVADMAVHCVVAVYYPMLVFGIALMLYSTWIESHL